MIRPFVAALAALAIGAGFAFADEGHDHDHGKGHDHSAKHGGIVEHTEHHHFELVAKGGTLELYITHEDGDAEDTSRAKATATVLADGKTEQVALAPAGGNALKGSGGFNAGKGTTVVVSLTMPDHEPEQVRFKLD
ncbi:hypothetical protein [Hyphomicrobium sp. CS1GBMeth3]|uniref:hypothetical protein n=1 Tax=Hyphomicrobium sp. CS1GBMeth3 TaxID=1892845 RepID=UPI00092FF96B|nr:hypothetical protein [Hyphomicrobium sp. CS1GBMeth3]